MPHDRCTDARGQRLLLGMLDLAMGDRGLGRFQPTSLSHQVRISRKRVKAGSMGYMAS